MVDEELIYKAQRVLHNRCLWWQNNCNKLFANGEIEAGTRSAIRANAYQSAYDILLAAMQGDKEILKEFDYYDDEADVNK